MSPDDDMLGPFNTIQDVYDAFYVKLVSHNDIYDLLNEYPRDDLIELIFEGAAAWKNLNELRHAIWQQYEDFKAGKQVLIIDMENNDPE